MKYLKKFQNHSQYESYIATDFVKPNVSYCVAEGDVHYNPIEPLQPNNIITYEASAKLAETTSNKTAGLHTNAFNTTIKSHTFENGVGTIEFNDDVTSIGNFAFYNCGGLTSITIPNSVTSIGINAFYNCGGLTSITIPSGVTSIGNYAFQNCSGLTSITIPNNVTTINNYCFGGCKNLTNITIGSGVTTIAEVAFQYCSGLTEITSLATIAPTIYSSTFRDVKANGTLYVPQGSSGYDTWMGTGDYYLGKYNWTKVEQ